MRRKLSFLLVALACIFLTSIGVKATNEYIYYEDFEDVVLNDTTYIDHVTKLIWAENYRTSKIVDHNGSKAFKWVLNPNSEYAVAGGIGVGSASNLNLTVGESYTASMYIKPNENLDFLFIEYVGADWGCINLYPDGKITSNRDKGNNIVDVSYNNGILNFTFTHGLTNGMNGYIKVTAYNTKEDAYIILDNVKIKKAELALKTDFNNYALGKIALDSSHTTFSTYRSDGLPEAESEIVEVAGNQMLQFSFQPQAQEGQFFAYINKLTFMVPGREYRLSFDYQTENLKYLWLYYGGTWVNPASYIKIDIAESTATRTGNVISAVEVKDRKISFNFTPDKNIGDWAQFQLIGEAFNLEENAIFRIDNLEMEIKPIVVGIHLDLERVKTTYYYNEDLDLSALKVYQVLSNGTIVLLDNTEYEVLGYDKEKAGKQLLTIRSGDFFETFSVVVNRKPAALILDYADVKRVYEYGESLDLSGLKVYCSFTDGGADLRLEQGALLGGYTVSFGDYDPFKPNTYEITVTYEDLSASFSVTVRETVSFGESDLVENPTAPASSNFFKENLWWLIGGTSILVSGVVIITVFRRRKG